jgi:membrane associated rhomboid family serine protease
MENEKKKFQHALKVTFFFLVVLWTVKLIEVFFNISFVRFGVLPRQPSGLVGIIFSPLIHASFNHLISNSIPLVFLCTGVLFFYPKTARKLFTIVYFVPGIFVWLFAREAYHIGASGALYGLVTFLFFSGIIRRDTRAIALSLIVTLLYGSLVWGIFPLDPTISWEGHLFGALTGIVCAFLFKKNDPYKKYDWEDEERDWDKNDLEIKYDNRV